MEKKPKILFISHTFPPITGGIENQNYEVSVWLGKLAEVKTIANRRGRYFLPIFAPYALIKSLFLLPRYDAILLGSGIVSIVGWFLKLFTQKPLVCIVHGLDINYSSTSLGVWYEKILYKTYQKLWVNVFLKKVDKFIAVGNETVKIAQQHGISAEKVLFIPNGIDTEKFFKPCSREKLKDIVKINVDGNKFILTSGRLAKRKGAAWFCRNVMPILPENFYYIIAGDGPDRENIESAIKEKNLAKRVFPLGYVTDEVRDTLFNTCDLFVQPNMKVPGDMEGFGLSVIEAASCQIPVVASEIEGLKDAIKDGQNGFLVESGNAEAWTNKVKELMAIDDLRANFGAKARQFVIDNYTWEKISKRYLEEIEKVLSSRA